jgi:Tfp pilus assembly protein PilN
MITINLKPGSRRAARGAPFAGGMSALKALPSKVKDPWPMAAVVIVALTVVSLAWIGLGSAAKVSSLEDKLAQSRSENRRYKTFLIEKRRSESARDSIVTQIATIRTVDGDRYVWPHVLDEVTRALPPFTWLTEMTAIPAPPPLDSTVIAPPPVSLELKGRTMDIQGFTRFMRQLEDSPWLQDVTLVATTTEIDHGRAVTAYTVRAAYTRPVRAKAPAAGARTGER